MRTILCAYFFAVRMILCTDLMLLRGEAMKSPIITRIIKYINIQNIGTIIAVYICISLLSFTSRVEEGR